MKLSHENIRRPKNINKSHCISFSCYISSYLNLTGFIRFKRTINSKFWTKQDCHFGADNITDCLTVSYLDWLVISIAWAGHFQGSGRDPMTSDILLQKASPTTLTVYAPKVFKFCPYFCLICWCLIWVLSQLMLKKKSFWKSYFQTAFVFLA